MSKKLDTHGAAKAGTKSEDILKLLFKRQGLQLLNKKSEFEKAGLDMNGRKYLKKPSWWHEKCLKTRTKGDEAIFKSDGYVDVCGGLIIELKSSNNHGTTEEKVFYDLEKIRDGFYGKQNKLIMLLLVMFAMMLENITFLNKKQKEKAYLCILHLDGPSLKNLL